MARRFTLAIFLSMLAGIAVGAACNAGLSSAAGRAVAADLSLVTDVFLRLIRMIIGPLVLSTLIAGVAHMGDARAIGRVGAKAIGWFLCASIASLVIGMVMVELLRPGAGLHLAPPVAAPDAAGVQTSLSAKDFLAHVFPTSVVDALAKNEILQIVVFSLFAGVAIASLGERASALLLGVEQLGAVMLKVTNYVMLTAPLAVFAAVAATVTTQGLGVLRTYAYFVGGFYLSLVLLWALLFLAARLVLGARAGRLMAAIRAPALLAFSTATSEAAYPRTLEELEAFGVSPRVASFVLPLGYSFNLDGSMILHLRRPVHRPGLRHPPDARPADRHAGPADGDQQGHSRSAESLARGARRHPALLSHSGGGAGAGAGGRPLPRHGPQRHQRDRQLDRRRRRGEVRGRARSPRPACIRARAAIRCQRRANRLSRKTAGDVAERLKATVC